MGINMIRASAPGKVILFGEHAIVYDKLGVAGAIDIRANTSVRKIKGPTKIFLKDFQKRTTIKREWMRKLLRDVEKLKKEQKWDELKKLSKNPNIPVAVVLEKALEEAKLKGNVELEVKSDISSKSGGMGSGSAVFASIAAGVQKLAGKKLDKKKISEIAFLGDVVAHGGTPSGIDNNTVTFGKYLKFRKSEGIRQLRLKKHLYLVIGDTKKRAQTRITVPNVRKLRGKNPEKINRILDKINKVSKLGIEAINKGDLEEVGRLMNENQVLLRELKVSSPELERLIKASLKAGALGAKLSGGGGGGIMIAICKNEKDQKRVADAIKKAKGNAIITKTGVEGVKVDFKYQKT